ncbi:hypothetical protein N9D37_01055 [Erythrobacter sp.]|nr:hypothetical protein [Erythrobacter sp.]
MRLTKLLAALLIAGAAGSGLLAVVSGEELVDHTIAHGLELERQFHEAEGAVDAFLAERGRFPSQNEFEELGPDGKYLIDLYPNGFTGIGFDCPRQFTKMSDGDYVLTTWRGEWMECYRPSLDLSTVATQRSDFTILGSIWLNTLFFYSWRQLAQP